MNEKKYKKNRYEKRLDFQQKMIARQSEQIDNLKAEIAEMTLECQKKDELINSVTPLREELQQNVNDVKKYKEQYKSLIQELKDMKKIMTQEVYKSQWRWKLIRFLTK